MTPTIPLATNALNSSTPSASRYPFRLKKVRTAIRSKDDGGTKCSPSCPRGLNDTQRALAEKHPWVAAYKGKDRVVHATNQGRYDLLLRFVDTALAPNAVRKSAMNASAKNWDVPLMACLSWALNSDLLICSSTAGVLMPMQAGERIEPSDWALSARARTLQKQGLNHEALSVGKKALRDGSFATLRYDSYDLMTLARAAWNAGEFDDAIAYAQLGLRNIDQPARPGDQTQSEFVDILRRATSAKDARETCVTRDPRRPKPSTRSQASTA